MKSSGKRQILGEYRKVENKGRHMRNKFQMKFKLNCKKFDNIIEKQNKQ